MKDRIKKIRTDAGLSQSDFAKKLSISRSAICKLEYGENQPSEQTLKLIQETFSVNGNWLRTGEGDPYVAHKISDMMCVIQLSKEDQEALAMFNMMFQSYTQLDSKSKSGVRSFIKHFLEQLTKSTESQRDVHSTSKYNASVIFQKQV